jgi:osmotically-inducible protein OsmY
MSTDIQLKQAVLAELTWEPRVNAAHIGVMAKAGVITLSGHVENFEEKYAAEKAVRRVRGVKAIAEEIDVQLPFERERGEDAIAEAAIDRLAWDVSIPRDTIMVKVEEGWITLAGEIDWHYQKEAAEQDIRRLSGVIGVSNQTTIKPRVNTKNISDDIVHALHRSWFFDPQTIKVTADGGKVRLSGTANSWHERQVAASTAWAAPGTIAVENNITVM